MQANRRIITHQASRAMAVAAATALGVGALATTAMAKTAAPHSVTVKSMGCDAGGFSGRIRVTTNTATRVSTVAYAIARHGVAGGNHANITVTDGGVAPTLVYGTNNGVQDGAYRTLATYTRGFGGFGADFTFDQTNATDPHCHALAPWS